MIPTPSTPSAARAALATQPRKPAGTPAAEPTLSPAAGVIGGLSPIRRIEREAEQAMRAGLAGRMACENARQERERLGLDGER